MAKISEEQQSYIDWFRELREKDPDLFQMIAGLTRVLFIQIENLETENSRLAADKLSLTAAAHK